MISTISDTRQLVENCFSLDVRRWVRSGALKKGAAFEVKRLLRDGLHTATVYPGPDAVRLEYPAGKKTRTFTVALDRTKCHLGGQRLWLRCPKCKGRVAKLFIVNELVRCRSCGNLSYRSQRQSTVHRLKKKEELLKFRLGFDYCSGLFHAGLVARKKARTAIIKVRAKLQSLSPSSPKQSQDQTVSRGPDAGKETKYGTHSTA